MRIVGIASLVLLVACGAGAQERTLDVGAQVAIAAPGQFEGGDVGVGARVAWKPSRLVGVEGEVNVYPQGFPDDRAPFSGSRVETLFGVTLGPRLGIIRPFGRVRPAALRYGEAPGPIVCIAIFPPPLSCQLAAGRTLFVVDVGGGVEIDVSRRSYVRIDVGDRIVRYPEPSPIGHDPRVGVGLAVRF
jgi:hypothetical protein